MKEIYFDHIAGTPLDPRVKEEMLPYLTDTFGNPKSMQAQVLRTPLEASGSG